MDCRGEEFSIDLCHLSKRTSCRSNRSQFLLIGISSQVFKSQAFKSLIFYLYPFFISRLVLLKCGGKSDLEERLCPTVAQTSHKEIIPSYAECGNFNWFVCETQPEVVHNYSGWCKKPKWSNIQQNSLFSKKFNLFDQWMEGLTKNSFSVRWFENTFRKW